ncbi:hypothetical protein AM587_10000921 [Phytophthora nicotianae]|uniref:Uncharacterized protein n=1 Tax=Phytophthora nicotianae TaxID=4792 RepID=A0A0W8D607_PHYNI|nr:hypothetical protein AM587_10002121 [Phytophthora nicotianae]KUF91825.1 hypothetical protein AM587_10000921 [Phytophthora nicotianae]
MVARDAVKKKVGSVEHQYLISPLHSQYEEELDRIRTEGDLTLIKVQTERNKLLELEVKLGEVNKQLRDRKKTPKQGENVIEAKEPVSNKGLFAALVMSTTGTKGAAKPQQLTTDPQGSETNTVKRVHTNTAKGRQLHTEERLKVAMAERAMELQKLRHAIDETRRKRLDALATEKQMLKDIQEDEEELKRAQEEIAQLKRQAVDVKNEIAATELEFDTEKQTFRLERQRLLAEVEGIVKADKQGTQSQPAPVSHKYSMFHNNIAQRRKQNLKASKWKSVSMEQNIVSFEQKKMLLDRIVEETNVKNLSEFIHKYNEQERTKAEIFARIEEQTATNAALNESIAQLTEDIARLTGAAEVDSIDDTAKPSAELQKVLDANDVHIKRWIKDADIYAEAVKCLRDPVHDVHKEFFPNDRTDEAFDGTATSESCTMRRIGAIEERIMQFIMAKILEETEASSTPNNSDTLRRLHQYQGRREQRDTATAVKVCSVEPPSTLKRGNNTQRAKDAEDEEQDVDNQAKDVAVIHPEVFRQKFIASSSSDNNTGNTATNASGLASTGSPTRKNATTALNL